MLVRKITLSKNDFIKAIFTNISAYEIFGLLSLNTSISNISIIILNKNLTYLTENDSGESGAAVFTIIGQNKHLKSENNKHQKGIGEIPKKELSKVTTLKNESQKENINQKKKIEIKPSKEHGTSRISEQKNLFTKVINITPYISPKHKMIMGEMQKQQNQINKLKQSKEKEKHSKAVAKTVNPTMKKNKIIKINKPAVTYISKTEKAKENTNKVTNNQKTSQLKPKQTGYSLQKKNSPGLVALFSATIASVIFSIGLAGIIGHKKSFPSVLAISSLAIIGLGTLANKKTHNKRLVKK